MKTVVLFDKTNGRPCGHIQGPQNVIDANTGTDQDYIETARTDIENFYVDVRKRKIIDRPSRPSPAHEWSWDTLTWSTTAESVRAERDRLLQESDWTQGRDVPEKIQKPWAEYRKSLRDISKQNGFPFAVTWPRKP
jgi:hypothetical protein